MGWSIDSSSKSALLLFSGWENKFLNLKWCLNFLQTFDDDIEPFKSYGASQMNSSAYPLVFR